MQTIPAQAEAVRAGSSFLGADTWTLMKMELNIIILCIR